jgi:hypothetical protein
MGDFQVLFSATPGTADDGTPGKNLTPTQIFVEALISKPTIF